MKKFSVVLAALSVLSCAAIAGADDSPLQASARRVAHDYGQSIVNITVVSKPTVSEKSVDGAQSEAMPETTSSTVGSVIDGSGLVVSALSAIDPQSRTSSLKTEGGEADGGGEIKMSSKISSLKYRLADGTEVPARVVLKDVDLDLAFVAPLQPLESDTKQKLVMLPLNDTASDAALADSIFEIGREDKTRDYSSNLRLLHIAACISKPRRCYSGGSKLGLPVFTAEGKLLGIGVSYNHDHGHDSDLSDGNPLSFLAELGGSSVDDSSADIILPIATVKALATQALQEAAKPAAAPGASPHK